MKKSVSPISAQDALPKILRYCAYQERSHQEVKNKLFGFGLRSAQVNELLAQLITDGFLNEERYAKAFAGGKFRMMKWGRLKIERQLKLAGLTSRCISLGLAEIGPSDYTRTMNTLIKKKWEESTGENIFKRKNKVAQFLMGKGYEPDLIWEALNELVA